MTYQFSQFVKCDHAESVYFALDRFNKVIGGFVSYTYFIISNKISVIACDIDGILNKLEIEYNIDSQLPKIGYDKFVSIAMDNKMQTDTLFFLSWREMTT